MTLTRLTRWLLALAISATATAAWCACTAPSGDFVRNGDFSTTCEWTPASDIAGGKATIPSNSMLMQLDLEQTLPAPASFIPGAVYTITFDATITGASVLDFGFFYYPDGDASVQSPWPHLRENLAGTHSYSLTFSPRPAVAGRPNTALFFNNVGSGSIALDNITVRKTPKTMYGNTAPIALGTFEPETEYWQVELQRGSGTDAAGPYGPLGAGELKVNLAADHRILVYRNLALDVDPTQLRWDLTLKVRTDTPQNIGRMYVVFRSPKLSPGETDPFVFHSFNGLKKGVNTIRVGSTLTTLNSFGTDPCYNQSDVTPSGKVCDLFMNPSSRSFDPAGTSFGYSWHEVTTIGIKIETNGNGPAEVYLDDLNLEPWPGSAARPSPARRAPIVTHVRVLPTSPSQATLSWRSDQCARSRVEYGPIVPVPPAAYASSAENGSETAFDHSVPLAGLTPGLRYHARVVSASCYTECTGGSCPEDPCAPCPAQGTGQTGISGDFTFIMPPSTPAVPAPGPGDPTFFPVGVIGVPQASDVGQIIDSGFNVMHSSLFGGCWKTWNPTTMADSTVTERLLAHQFLDALLVPGTQTPRARAVVTALCPETVLNPQSLCTPACAPLCTGGGSCGGAPNNVALRRAYVQDKVADIASHPALFAYQLLDEPELADPTGISLLAPMQCAYRALRDQDQTHTVLSGITYFTPANPYTNPDNCNYCALDPDACGQVEEPEPCIPGSCPTGSCPGNGCSTDPDSCHNNPSKCFSPVDTPWHDPYPFPTQPIAWMIDKDVDGTIHGGGLADAQSESQRTGKPYHHAFQAYSSELDRKFPIETEVTGYPTEAQMRVMAYLGVIYGARGEWAFAYSDIGPFAGTEWVWAGLSNVARELRRIEPVLGSTALPAPYPLHPPVTVAPGQGCCANVQTRIKGYQGVPYLFTANAQKPVSGCDCAAANATRATIALPSSLTALRVGETGSLTTNASGLTDDWGVDGVHVYRLEDHISPTAAITYPAQSAHLKKNKVYFVTAAASDNVGVQQVDILKDGVQVSSETFSPPASSVQSVYEWVSTVGAHTFQARSTDTSGNVTLSTVVSVSVN